MEGIGAEVSLKIRSAIKAKLMELGAYVDEELPDYIMVMVANKKSREQMEDDLHLFLGSNTEEFTVWLHQVLQKLQEVTVASLERKRKSSAAESEGESSKKEKHKKSSDKKKVRRSSEQVKAKDSKSDSENTNQLSGKHKELEKVSKCHSTSDHNVSSNQVNINIISDSVVTVENVGKSQGKTSKEHNRTESVSHKLDNLELQVCSDSESSLVKKLQGDDVGKSLSSSVSGTSDSGKITLTDTCSKIVCSSVEESCNVPGILNPVKKDTNRSDNGVPKCSDPGKQCVVKKVTAEVKPNAAVHVTKPKIVLMHSDDDDDEDFINIKADAEAEELLDAELPKETSDSGRTSIKKATNILPTVLSNRSDSSATLVSEDKQNVSSVRGIQLSDRLGAKVTSGSILDRLGVRRVTTLARDTSKHVSPLLRVTDRLGDKVSPPVTDRLGNKKVGSLRSDSLEDKNNSEERQCGITSRLSSRLGTKISSGFPSDKRSISLLSPSERRNVSVAQIAPTTVNRISKLINIKETAKSETDQLGQKTMRRPLDTAEEVSEKEQVPRKRPLLSRVVAMHKETGEKEEEEEYDPANPAVGSVASVVRVKPRPKVPAALQANKNLILKAMAEAQKSVANAPKRVEPSERPDSLYTRKFRDKGRDKIAITLPNRRMQPHKESPTNEKSTDIERIVIPVKLEASRSISSVNLQQKIVIQVSSDKPVSQETVTPSNEISSRFEEEPVENITADLNTDYDVESTKIEDLPPDVDTEVKDDTYDEVQRLLAYESQSSWSKDLELDNESSAEQPTETSLERHSVSLSRAESPQFVVTLDGLDPAIFQNSTRKIQQSSSLSLSSPDIEIESPTVEYEEKEVIKEEEVQKEKQPEKKPVSPILYKKASSPQSSGAADALKQKINERCKYWPACRSGDKCDYLHPTALCKSFPSCKFGDKCLYIHPNCKFDASCTRRDCPFTHASPRAMSSSASSVTSKTRIAASATKVSQQVCKFFPKCTNTSCRFLHPKPCRYGRYCSRKAECSFLHEEIPSADKLKWFCPFKL